MRSGNGFGNIGRAARAIVWVLTVGILFLMSPAWAAAADAGPPAQSGSGAAAAEISPPPEEEWLNRSQKTLLLNAGGLVGIVTYGFLNWDYGKEDFNFRNEHWFQRDTEEGGMDKVGHFWSSYAFAHLLSNVYHRWGYTESESNLYGALSSFGLQGAMEIMDGFSGYGVSYEDFLMNTAGAAIGYLWGRYPTLKKMVDFRMEYFPSFDEDDLDPFTNYRDQKYLIAIKAEGFELLQQPVIEYLELHAGYYARGYEEYQADRSDDRRRYAFVGLGINVTKLLKNFFDISVFDYLQMPYTSINFEYNFD